MAGIGLVKLSANCKLIDLLADGCVLLYFLVINMAVLVKFG